MDWNRLLDDSDKVLKIVAVIVAACWVYFNSLRGRTFVPRLQVEVSGKFFSKRSRCYLLVTMQAKNVGSSRIWINQKGTALKVNHLRRKDGPPKLAELKREATQVFSVLTSYTIDKKGEKHVTFINTIEPGSAHMEQKLISIPQDEFPDLELELRVVAHRQSWWIPEWVFNLPPERFIPETWKGRSWRAIGIPVEVKNQDSTSTK